MKKFDNAARVFVAISFGLLAQPAYASGNPLLVLYDLSDVFVQLTLLVVGCLQWRRSRALFPLIAVYVVVAVVIWRVIWKLPADFHPFFVAFVGALLPWAASFLMFSTLVSMAKKKSIKGDGDN